MCTILLKSYSATEIQMLTGSGYSRPHSTCNVVVVIMHVNIFVCTGTRVGGRNITDCVFWWLLFPVPIPWSKGGPCRERLGAVFVWTYGNRKSPGRWFEAFSIEIQKWQINPTPPHTQRLQHCRSTHTHYCLYVLQPRTGTYLFVFRN